MKTYSSYIFDQKTYAWKKVKPIIINITNMGKIPFNALLTSEGIPFLTNSKEFFLVDPTTSGLTATSANDYLRYEELKYTAYINSKTGGGSHPGHSGGAGN